MKYIKLFENFKDFKIDDFYKNNSQLNKSTKEECINILSIILKSYHIYKFTINDDMTVDAYQNVSLKNIPPKFEIFNKLPIKFGKVYGNFNISAMKLISLDGSPYYVDGNFICTENNLSNLKGSPGEVTKNFVCQINRLESLEGMTPEIGGDFVCYDNPSLKELNSTSNIEGNIL